MIHKYHLLASMYSSCTCPEKHKGHCNSSHSLTRPQAKQYIFSAWSKTPQPHRHTHTHTHTHTNSSQSLTNQPNLNPSVPDHKSCSISNHQQLGPWLHGTPWVRSVVAQQTYTSKGHSVNPDHQKKDIFTGKGNHLVYIQYALLDIAPVNVIFTCTAHTQTHTHI